VHETREVQIHKWLRGGARVRVDTCSEEQDLNQDLRETRLQEGERGARNGEAAD